MTDGRAGAPPKINHLGVVVRDLAEAASLYRLLGCDVSDPVVREDQGIAKVFVHFGNMMLELIQPTTADSPIKDMLEDHNASDFLARRPEGGLHHVCVTVDDLQHACDMLTAQGYKRLGTGDSAARGLAWFDPAGADGVLVELKQGGPPA